MKPEPNHLLRQARMRAPSPSGSGRPMSRQELADEANKYLFDNKDRLAAITANYIGKLERGLFRWPSHDYREAFRHVLSASSDSNLGFFIRRPDVRLGGDADAPVAYSWTMNLQEALVGTQALWSERLPVQPDRAADGVTEEAAFRWLIASPDRHIGRHGGQRRVGQSDVQRIRTTRASLKAVDNAHGGGAVMGLAIAFLRQDVAHLLNEHYDEGTGQDLLSAVAELTLDVGWMAYDLGHHRLAARHMSHALRLSHAAGDRLFGSRVLAAMSHQALHLGQSDVAVDLAKAATLGAGSAATPRVGAMLSAMEAMVHAARRDQREFAASLRAAEDALDAARDGDAEPGWLDFDEGGLWGHAARAHRYLGQGRKCVSFAEQSLDLCRIDHGRTRTQRQAILAAGQLAAGDAEAAAATGIRVIAAARGLRSRHVDQEVRALTKTMRSRGSAAAASKDFLGQANEYLATRDLNG